MAVSSRAGFTQAANALARLKARKEASGARILDLSSSNPSAQGLSHDPEDLASAFGSPGNAIYRPDPRGLYAAREAVATATGADPSSLWLCASTSEAYGWLFKLLCDPGDSVLVPRPGYPLFDQLARLEAVKALPYDLDYIHPQGWNIDMDGLEERLSSEEGRGIRALILINPNNPTGSYIRDVERERIISLCLRCSLALVVDEVFFGFPLEPREGVMSFLGESRVPCFVLDGLSKRLCLPQAKLGWISLSGPPKETSRMAESLDIIADAFLSAGTPVMNALPSLFALEGSIKRRVSARMKACLEIYRSVLEGGDSPHRVLRCEGGWTAMVESPALESEEDLALSLLEAEDIYAHPGYFFDLDRGAHFAFSLILEEPSALRGAQGYLEHFSALSRRLG
ncbi:MAG TPA: pyridoxal phosphate-dependent aminotransferase [Rectinemataceae bacterium]